MLDPGKLPNPTGLGLFFLSRPINSTSHTSLHLSPSPPSAPPVLPTRKSYARILAESSAFPKVEIPVHAPAFTDKGEPALLFSREEIEVGPLNYNHIALVAKTSKGFFPFEELRELQRFHFAFGY